jgi:integrase
MTIRHVTYTKNQERRKSKKLYADFYDHNEVRRKLPLFVDSKNSDEAARAIERLVGIRASDNVIPPELRRFIAITLPRIRDKLVEWNIIPSSFANARQSLDELVDLWKKSILADGVDAQYAEQKAERVKKLFRDKRLRRWQDITAEKVRTQLQVYREATTGSIGVTTSNHYLQAVKQFCRWVVDEERAIVSPVAGMKPVDDGGKLRHDRRALDIEEFHYLMDYLESAPTVFKIPGEHRILIYTFAAETGLRSGAIKRLPVKHVEIYDGRPSVFVPKKNRIKYSADRWIPIRDDLWQLIKPLLDGRAPTELVFKMPTRGHAAKMVKRDVDAARSTWIASATTQAERQQREASDFLRYEDSSGKFIDFHAFRHTRGVWLFKHHRAEGRAVQDLMGVGSLGLVDRYARSFKDDHSPIVERGPKLRSKPLALANTKVPTENDVSSPPEVPKSLYHSLPQDDGIQRISTDSGGQSDEEASADSDGQTDSKTPEKQGLLTLKHGSDIVQSAPGEVAEWLNAPVSKTGLPARVARVRISPSPLGCKAR